MSIQFFSRYEKSPNRVRIFQRINRGTPEERYSTINDERLDGINELLSLKVITPGEAKKRANKIVEELRNKNKPKKFINNVNQVVLERYWEKRGSLKDRKDHGAAYRRLKRGLAALGSLDIALASDKEILTALAKNINNRTTLRDAVASIRQILKFIGRPDIYLPKPRPEHKEVRYLTLEQFKQILPGLSHGERLVVWAAFGTGARQGEIWSINKIDPSGRAVWIAKQITRKNKPDSTKTGRKRWAYVIPEAREFIKEWIEFKDKEEIRNLRWSEIVKLGCKRAEVPPITFHDLRHCYAIHLLQQSNSLEKVSRWLGNSITVCERYYTGYVGTLADLDGVV